jgi:hypothetical protein
MYPAFPREILTFNILLSLVLDIDNSPCMIVERFGGYRHRG